jgi:hypothetical protein
MLMNGIILTINKHDTLRPLRIQIRPFVNSVGVLLVYCFP